MKKKILLITLSVIIILTAGIIIKKSFEFNKEVRNVKVPTKESRHLGEMSTYKWVTVKNISKKHNLSEEEVFKTLQIDPEAGDENLEMKKLAKKYNIPNETMKENLSKIIGTKKDVKGTKK